MRKQKKSFILLFVTLYFVIDFFGTILYAKPAKAQWAVTDPGLYGILKASEVKNSILNQITGAAMGALMNSLSFMVRKVAYDTATAIATGDRGRSPLAFDKSAGAYWEDVTGSAAGELIGSLGEPFGLNLCQIPDAQFNINLKLGLSNLFPQTGTSASPESKCTWQDLKNNWSVAALEEKYGEGGSNLGAEIFSGSISVDQSGLGVAVQSAAQIDAAAAKAGAAANIERIANQGFKDVVSAISGKILTPASQIRKEAESLSAAEQQKLNATQIAGIYGSQLKSLPLMAANVFITTLSQQLLQKVMTGLLPDTPSEGVSGPSTGIASFFAASLESNKKVAERAFSFLTAPSINQIDNYDIVGDLTTNKVIDSGFEQAINRGKSSGGVYLTIQEAIEQNLLHGNWQLIPPTNSLNSSEAKDCYIKAYCYSNIQKLRKARILPVGFELAALKSNPDRPWNLSEVVNGFYDCNSDDELDATHPYCHLINPNWIIKAPQTRCGSEGYGPNLVDNATALRQTECMDLQTCISESADGSCLAWGYCTKEKNIWKLDGDECPSYYATCTTYTNTATRANSSYLARTVDFGQCDAQSVGCQGYSTEKVGDNWVTYGDINNVGGLKTAGRPGSIYFNRNVETCPASSDGCTAFYGVQRDANTGLFTLKNDEYIRNTSEVIYLKKAPDYLGCYDTDTSVGSETIINWPQTEAEVLNMNTPGECDKYAQACAPSEAGCSLYTSTQTGDTVSAIVKEQNGCPAECSGYETFKQRESNFEPEKFPLHFIPSLGTVCSAQYVGCDEFTNLEKSTQGGEQLEYYNYIRYCEKPNTVSEKTFFSWEGSSTEGFVLRNYRLKAIDAGEASYISGLALEYDYDGYAGPDGSAAVDFAEGSPAYSDNTQAALQNDFNLCNKTAYVRGVANIFDPAAASADCRQFYDNEGNEYYRLMENTVVISDQCVRLRKSDSRLYVDAGITVQATCENQGKGVWDAGSSQCNRCYGGGKAEGNVCVYQALPEESSSCPAAVNGCRAYTGNTGNNLRLNIIVDSFESTTTTGDWELATPTGSTISISTESLQRGQNSLRISNEDGEETLIRHVRLGTTEAAVSLQTNGWYELSFWARGAPQNVEISFVQDGNVVGLFTHEALDETAVSPISIGDNWREYTLGPVQFTGNGLAEVEIDFYNQGSDGAYFIDNVRLSQIQDSAYLIKDSWKQPIPFDVNGDGILQDGEVAMAEAPATCFASGENPLGVLPGFALGCSEYKDENNNTYYLTGFSSLCREDAVGCQPLFDTNNTLTGEDARLPKVYNAVCSYTDNSSGLECSITYFGATASCFIVQGEHSCYLPEITLPINDNGTPTDFDDDEYRNLTDLLAYDFGDVNVSIDLSSVYVLPESGVPIYLTNRAEYNCPSGDMGCMLLGKQDQVLPSTTTLSYEYSDIYIKNNPENYDNILCRQDLIGCNEYTAGANTYYFRDPVETGNSICTYRENVNGFDGWYKKEVGRCASSPTNYCRNNDDCTGGDDCVDIGSVPCYEDYLKDDIYSIWSNDSSSYNGFVGSCSNKYNACTELLDPADTSSIDPEGQKYYRIFNDKLTERTSDCNGQVSLKDGCVLFDRTDQPNKFYFSDLTYDLSNNTDPKFGFVNPVGPGDTEVEIPAGAEPDTNLLLKVTRDRDCAEWLSCSNKTIVRNDKGERQELCSNYRACEEFKVGGGVEQCLRFVSPIYGETFLDEKAYISRDLSWYGKEYSGYSILNKQQISIYSYFTFPSDPGEQFLGAVLPAPSYIPNNCSADLGDTNGNPCGTGLAGRCLGNKCITKIDGSSFPTIDLSGILDEDERTSVINSTIRDGLVPSSCKIYPEEDSPYPYLNIAYEPAKDGNLGTDNFSRIKVNDNITDKSRIEYSIFNGSFGNVNLCQGDEDCSCEYNKYSYGDFVDYYPIDNLTSAIPDGVCSGGEKNGQPCSENKDCVVRDSETDNGIISQGQCEKLEEVQTRLGIRGFCLEPDLSRPINGKSRYAPDQDYACQTWLPIQTSASSIDLFNLNVNAGYNPDVDANPGVESGELYCAAISRGGFIELTMGTEGDPDWRNRIQDEIGDDEFDNKYMDDWFDAALLYPYCATGYTIPVTSNSENTRTISEVLGWVEGSDKTPFYDFFCSTFNQGGMRVTPSTPNDPGVVDKDAVKDQADSWRPFIYKLLTSFGWNRIGNNSMLLRAEYSFNKDLIFTSGGTQASNLNASPRFAPWVGGEAVTTNDYHFPDFEDSHGAFIRYTESGSFNTDNDTTAYGGLYNFIRADRVVNRDSVKDMYFIPLLYKGTVRGAVPKTINDLANPTDGEEAEWNSEVLRLPIKGLNNGTVTNGEIVPIRGVHLDSHYADDEDPQGTYTTINFSHTGGKNASSINEEKTIPMTGFGIDNSDFSNNPLLVWRYKVEKGDGNNLFFEDNVQTKYVLVFFANDTGLIDYMGHDNDKYTTRAPQFIESHLSGTSGAVPTPLVPTSVQQDPFQTNCQRGYVAGLGTGVETDGSNQLHQQLPHYGPWWAVAVNFDEDGKFVGYTTKWCRGFTSEEVGGDHDDGGGDENENASLGAGISFAVFADLANQCSEYVKVYDSDQATGARTSNKAWTNRVWAGAVNSDNTPLTDPAGVYSSIFNRQTAQTPFASVNLGGEFLTASNLANPELTAFSFENRDQDGIPYSCNYYDSALKRIANVVNNNDSTDPEKCAFSKQSDYRDNTGTYNGGSVMDVLRNSVSEDAYNAIYQLFALQFIRAKLYPGTLSIGSSPGLWYVDSSVSDMDISDVTYGEQNVYGAEWQFVIDEGPAHFEAVPYLRLTEYLVPPSVFSLNPITCQIGEDGGVSEGCTAGDFNNITVNARTGITKDYDGENGIDETEYQQSKAQISIQSISANIKFFAFADDNKMPIRKVSVDWGDNNLANSDRYGYYKNSKPICSGDPNGIEIVPLCLRAFEGKLIPSGLVCGQDSHCPNELTLPDISGGGISMSDPKCISSESLRTTYENMGYASPRFGNAPRACTTNPFEFEHQYTCDSSMPASVIKEFRTLSVGTQSNIENEVEIYNSTVEATDQIPLPVPDDYHVCVFKPKVQVIDNWGYCNGRCGDEDSPGSVYCYNGDLDTPSVNDECVWDVGDTGNTPWTEYKGQIVVVPTIGF